MNTNAEPIPVHDEQQARKMTRLTSTLFDKTLYLNRRLVCIYNELARKNIIPLEEDVQFHALDLLRLIKEFNELKKQDSFKDFSCCEKKALDLTIIAIKEWLDATMDRAIQMGNMCP